MTPSKDSVRCDKCLVWMDSEYEAYCHLREFHPVEFSFASKVLEENRPKIITKPVLKEAN